MTKNKKESHYLIVMMKTLLNYPDTQARQPGDKIDKIEEG